MWEAFSNHPLGRLSTRKYLHFASMLLMVCFLYIFTSAPTALAADAEWQGDAITYDGNDYTGPNTAKSSDGLDLPADTVYYAYLQPVTGPTSPNTKAYIIYFATGVDPPTATSAKHAVYDFNGTKFSNQSNLKTISLTPPAEAASTNEGTTSCAVEGIGWIVCPITTYLAKGMDFVFKLIDGFLEVRPLEATQNGAMYRSWSFMRNFANIAFVIAFLIIIYSQLTNFGMSNFGIKKMLPRIIVAAILVNTSYWICAASIDIFNILGYSIQDLFISMRNSLVGTEGNSWNVTSWESISGFILSGGTLAAASIIGISIASTAVAGAAGGLIFLLLPMLLGFILVVLATFIILAARQAIITILVIIAPLAFVAYLLPNTEKWFEKWRSIFVTMLVLFPAFSVVFGGSQLAGAVIIQNANSINMILLGMAVQIAPLAITPLLLKLGGGVLNRFAGIVNNPSKGMLDRTRNWSKDRLDARRAGEMARNRELHEGGNLRRRNFARRHALGRENAKFDREKGKAANESYSQGMWSQRRQARNIYERGEQGKLEQSLGDAMGHEAWNNRLHADPALRAKQHAQFAAQHTGDIYKSEVEATGKEMFEHALHGNAALSQIKIDAHTAEGRAKLFEDNLTANAESQLKNIVLGDRALRQMVIQTNEFTKRAETADGVVKARSDAHWNHTANVDPGLRNQRLEQHSAAQSAKVAEEHWNSILADIGAKGGATPGLNAVEQRLAGSIQKASVQLNAEALHKSQAETDQKSQFTKSVLENTLQVNGQSIREYAGGVRGIAGAETVLASAVAADRKEYGDRVAEKTQLIKHFNPPSTARQLLAMGTDVPVEKDGVRYIFSANDEYAREAAIEEQLKTGSYSDKMAIINSSGASTDANGNILLDPLTGKPANAGVNYDYRTTIASAIVSNGLDNSALFWGAKTIDDISQGKYLQDATHNAEGKAILYHVAAGKPKADKVATQDATALRAMFEIVNQPALIAAMTPAEQADFHANYAALKQTARLIVDTPELSKLASQSSLKVFEQYKA